MKLRLLSRLLVCMGIVAFATGQAAAMPLTPSPHTNSALSIRSIDFLNSKLGWIVMAGKSN